MLYSTHFHGHKLILSDIGAFKKNNSFKVPAELLRPSYHSPDYKDTVLLNPGYIRLKFWADNPGFRVLHCHMDWHLAIGIGLIIQVGEIDDMVQTPINFPKCGNYQPDIKWSWTWQFSQLTQLQTVI